MKQLLIWLCLIGCALAQTSTTTNTQSAGGSGSGGCIATVATLSSSCGTKAGTLASVTDGSTTSDCTVGGGTNKNACIYSGSAWAFAGSSGSAPTFAQVLTGTNTGQVHTVGSGGTLNVASGAVIDFSLTGTGTFKIPQSAGCTSSATKNVCLDTTANLLHVYQSLTDSTFGTGAFAAAYSLPTATNSVLGGVKPDGTSILNTAGAISVTPASIGLGNVTNNAQLPLAGGTMTGKLNTLASATGGAGLNLPPGTAPTSPTNGDCWTTSLGLYCQIAGVTVGPYGTGSGGSSAGSQYGIQYNSNGSGGFAGITPPATNCLYNINYNVTASAAVAPTAGCPGFSGRAVTGTTATDTILYSDNLLPVDYQGSVAVAVTLPTATTLANAKFATELVNNTSGSSTAVTVTPTTWTINGSATLVIAQGQSCKIKADPSGTNWDADCHDLPMVAGTNVTIARNQYGPTISVSATQTIASGTSALGTTSIASGACATVVTTTATGTASTDAIEWTPNASIKAVTGYAPSTSGGLSIAGYPTSGNVNFDVCNWSSGSITPGAVTLNWRVVR